MVKKTKLTPIKAMRKKCLDCTADSYKEVRECHIISCPLWLYRKGTRPDSETLSIYNKFAGETDYLPYDFFDRNGKDE